MARIKFGWTTGTTLTYGAYQADGTVRTAAGTSLPEIGTTGYYTVEDANLQVGDVVIIKDNVGNFRGWSEYLPGANCVLIEGSDFTDTLIGADGDTLETLSDQLDALSAEASKVINKYGPGE